MSELNRVDTTLLEVIAGMKDGKAEGAFNIRKDSGCAGRVNTENVTITTKTDKPGIDIRFVHADGKLAIGFRGDDRDAVDKERVSHRIGIRRDEHKHIDVRYRGADEPVPPRLHMVDAAFPVRVETAADPVAHQR